MDGLWKAVLYVPLWKAGGPPCQKLSTVETIMPWGWQWMFPVWSKTWSRAEVPHWCSQGAFPQPLKFLRKMCLMWRHWCFTALILTWILLWKNSWLQGCCGCNWLIDFWILQVVIIWNRDEFLIFFYEVCSMLLDLGVHSLVVQDFRSKMCF